MRPLPQVTLAVMAREGQGAALALAAAEEAGVLAVVAEEAEVLVLAAAAVPAEVVAEVVAVAVAVGDSRPLQQQIPVSSGNVAARRKDASAGKFASVALSHQ